MKLNIECNHNPLLSNMVCGMCVAEMMGGFRARIATSVADYENAPGYDERVLAARVRHLENALHTLAHWQITHRTGNGEMCDFAENALAPIKGNS